MTLRERFHAARPRLSQAERQVLDVILGEFDVIPGCTVTETARRAHTSEATVVRASKSLGFASYHSLRIAIAEERGLSRRSRLSAHGERDLDKVLSNMQRLAELISKTAEMLPGQLVRDIGDVLSQAEIVLFTAAGNSMPPALDASYRLSRLGVRAVLPTDVVGQAALVQTLDSDSVVVAVSESGATIPVLEVAKMGKQRGCKLVTFTSTSRSPLGALGGIQVILPSEREGEDLLLADALGSRILYSAVISTVIEYMVTEYADRFAAHISTSSIGISGVGRKI